MVREASPPTQESLLHGLFPDYVRTAEMFVRDGEPDALFGAERAQIAGAVTKRQREYAAVRQLAHQLLFVCGVQPEPLLNGLDRAPIWPQGIVGSLSHCAEHAIAMVACSRQVRAIGCDIEPAKALPISLVSRVLLPDEEVRLEAGPDWLGRLMFSAKESLYKAQYPLTRTQLDFDAVEIKPDLASKSFSVVIPQGIAPFPAGRHIQGRFVVRERHLCTAIVLDHRLQPVV